MDDLSPSIGDNSPNSKLTLRELLPVVFSKAMLSLPLRMLGLDGGKRSESTSVLEYWADPDDDWNFLLLLGVVLELFRVELKRLKLSTLLELNPLLELNRLLDGKALWLSISSYASSTSSSLARSLCAELLRLLFMLLLVVSLVLSSPLLLILLPTLASFLS